MHENLSPPQATSPKLLAPPLFSEDLIIKQLDTSSNTEEELAAFDLAFPVFRQLDEAHFFEGGWTPVLTGLGGKTVYVGRGRERRYAGDKTLERGRYWSICSSREGFDHGTLSNEVRAYHGYMSRSRVYIYDTTCDRDRLAALHAEQVIDIGIVLEIAQRQFGNCDRPFLLLMIRAMKPGKQAEAAKLIEGRMHLFLYGLRVDAQRIDNLFDLRRAACRRWLFQEFLPFELEEGERRRAKNNVALYGSTPPSTIETMFPILLSPEIGGANPFIQALGSWLRCQGCQGIVFPSARSDFFASERGGTLATSAGWNFVDFRGASPARWQDHIGHITSFNIYLGEGFSLNCSEVGDCADIQSKGLLQQNIGRFNTMAHHANEGTDPTLLDLSKGYLSVLDISQETLAKTSTDEADADI